MMWFQKFVPSFLMHNNQATRYVAVTPCLADESSSKAIGVDVLFRPWGPPGRKLIKILLAAAASVGFDSKLYYYKSPKEDVFLWLATKWRKLVNFLRVLGCKKNKYQFKALIVQCEIMILFKAYKISTTESYSDAIGLKNTPQPCTTISCKWIWSYLMGT